MSSPVYTVQEDATGMWVSDCCDERCGYFPHQLVRTPSEKKAKEAATFHRRFLSTLLPEDPERSHTNACHACGQDRLALVVLQDLVRQLEEKLSHFTEEDPHE